MRVIEKIGLSKRKQKAAWRTENAESVETGSLKLHAAPAMSRDDKARWNKKYKATIFA